MCDVLQGIDQLLCQKLFMAWLTNEYRDTSEHLTTCLSDERSRLVVFVVSILVQDCLSNMLGRVLPPPTLACLI